MTRLLAFVVGCSAFVAAEAQGCVLYVHPDGGVCLHRGPVTLACAWYLSPSISALEGYRLAVPDKATKKWVSFDNRSYDSARSPMARAVDELLGDTLPVAFNGVATGSEKNPCTTAGLFGRKDVAFFAHGTTTKVSSGESETIWELLQSGALMTPW